MWHREELAAYRSQHRAEKRAYDKRYWGEHRERRLAQKRALYERDRDRILAARRAQRDARRDLDNALRRERYRTNPAMYLAHRHARRATLTANGGAYTAAEWAALLALYENKCAYCGASRPLHVDHRIPIARGGRGDIANVLPACGPCNYRKGTMTEAEFRTVLSR